MKINIQKIIDDTLKEPHTGRFSRKSLTMFVSFVVSILIGFIIVFSHYVTKNQVDPISIQVFYGFLMLSGGSQVMTVIDKFKNKTHQKNNEEIPEGR